MSLFLRMDAAVLEELDPVERQNIDPILYMRIIEICARVGGSWQPTVELEDPVPRPPATQHIRVDLVIPDDFVWRTDLSFDQVESVLKETGEVVIVYAGGRTTTHDPREHLRVAVSPDKAIRWNSDRLFMGETTLQSVAEAYGVF
jgi:hypothetical protein